MRGFGRGLVVGFVLLIVVALFLWKPWEQTQGNSGLTNCGGGVYVQAGQTCPGQSSTGTTGGTGTTPDTGTTPPPVGNTPVVSSNGPSIVQNTGAPCPSTDFSLQQGTATCTFAGGKLLICEGDLNDSLGVQHDSNPTTGQVDEIDQAATIDGRDNGGSCHYSPPWTLAMSISSVKHGCACASVLVYKDGQLTETV